MFFKKTFGPFLKVTGSADNIFKLAIRVCLTSTSIIICVASLLK